MALESETGQVKREADKSYKLETGKSRPDLASEVVFSRGGINKLEAYRRLRISEVWVWEDDVLEIYHLRNESDQLEYEQIDKSEAIPGIDLALLLRCISLTNHVDAVRTWQQSIQLATEHSAIGQTPEFDVIPICA